MRRLPPSSACLGAALLLALLLPACDDASKVSGDPGNQDGTENGSGNGTENGGGNGSENGSENGGENGSENGGSGEGPVADGTWRVVDEEGNVVYEGTDIDTFLDGGAEGSLRAVAGAGRYELVASIRFGGTSLALEGQDGAEATVLVGPPDGAVLVCGQGAACSLGGLTLTEGSGEDVSRVGRLGGCVAAHEADDLSLEDVVLIGCRADYGGALVGPLAGTTTLRRTTVEGNEAQVGGGFYAASVTCEDATVTGNTATYGGGFVLDGNATPFQAVFTTCPLYTNTATEQGGCGMTTGRGEVTGLSCEQNEAFDSAGVLSQDRVTFNSCTFRENVTEYTNGTLTCEDGCDLSGASFEGNVAQAAAGCAGLYTRDTASCEDCSFFGNEGVACAAVQASAPVSCVGCSFLANNASSGAAVAVSEGSSFTATDVAFGTGEDANATGDVRLYATGETYRDLGSRASLVCDDDGCQ